MADPQQSAQPSRYVEMPNGSYLEWPEGVSADEFKAKASQFNTPPAEPDTRNRVQKAFDTLTTVTPEQRAGHSLPVNMMQDFGAHVMGMASPLVHPFQTVKGMANSLNMSNIGPALQEAKEHPENKPPLTQAIPQALGDVAGAYMGGEAAGGLVKGVAAPIAKSIREASMENPDAAALKGLQVGPKSKATLKTLSSVEGARPFLKGAQSLEDLQAKVPAAKSEIWAPYKQAVDAIGDRPIQGPDGMTTVRALEDERLQLSAINRGLRSKIPDPESVQLAQQKGLTQAQLLAKEKAVKATLLPELAKTGIKPDAILKAFGQVSRVGENISGKSTLGEKAVPSGLGKIANLSLERPLQAPQNIWGGVKDIAAGRPLFRMKPTDVGIREGFRAGGPKPDFGTFQQPMVKGLLPRPSLEDLPLHDPFVDATNTPSYDFTKSPFPVPTVEGAKNFNLQGVLKRSR